MASVGEVRVCLDHLIGRQSIRYIQSSKNRPPNSFNAIGRELSDTGLRYDDIRKEWFRHLCKPDFQRETNAWTPNDCLDFIESVINGRIIPSIILWRSQENTFVYVLDGAHRLSVIRAWMIDDWGDKANDYYVRRDEAAIKKIAQETRELIKKKIGSFHDFELAWQEQADITRQGKAPKQVMDSQRFAQADFYNSMVGNFLTLPIQWERGNYESAEQSFLRINRRGQVLDDWEANLIEFRRGSYARSIMCIANGGEGGHYWPNPNDDETIPEQLAAKIKSFGDRASKISKCLFVPPFRTPITTLNTPLMVAPAYFQKHKYLLEIIPLIVDKEIAKLEEQQLKIMKADATAPVDVVVSNAERILTSMEDSIEHLISPTNNSKSLSIVPLFYWYNQKAQYARGLLYGFIHWLLSGSTQDITDRKIIFSANRDRFEHFLFYLKSHVATLQERGGAGLYSTKRISQFFQAFVALLEEKSSLEIGSEALEEAVFSILKERARMTARQKKAKSSRIYSKTDRSQINIRELFENAIRCHICGGVVNLQHGGIQYDHTEDYALTKVTDPETGKPTHPFCNLFKKQIQALRNKESLLKLPHINWIPEKKEPEAKQLKLSFWGDSEFPE